MHEGATGEVDSFLEAEQTGTGPGECGSGGCADGFLVADAEVQSGAGSSGDPDLGVGAFGVLGDIRQSLLNDAVRVTSQRRRDGVRVLDLHVQVDPCSGRFPVFDELGDV